MANPLVILSQHPYFASLPQEALTRISQQLVCRTYERGAVIYEENEPAQGLYLVASGTIWVVKNSEDGKEQVLYQATAGQSFNDVAAFDGGANMASAQAVEVSMVLLVPRTQLHHFVKSYPEIALIVIGTMSSRLREMSMLVEDLAFRHVVCRVAGALLRLAGSESVAVLPTRQELAAMVGTVREVATRTLRRLERLAAIRLEPGRRAIIRDRAMLERLSGNAWPTSPVPPGPSGIL